MQENSRKTSISALLTTSKPVTVWITTNCETFLKRWEYQTTWPASWEIWGTTDWFQIGKSVSLGCILSPCLFSWAPNHCRWWVQAWNCWGSVRFPWFCLAAAEVWSDRRTSVIAQCYWQAKENTSWRWEGRPTRKMGREEKPQINFGSSSYMFFLPYLSLSHVNWASQEGCLFYLRSSLRSLDLPLVYFGGLFHSLSFSHHHFGLLFPILTT